MKLELHVCSKELAIKLKELGVKQTSYFYHYNEPYNDGTDEWLITSIKEYKEAYPNKSKPYSAFSIEEIFEFIPSQFFKDVKLTINSCIDNVIRPVEYSIKHCYHIKLMPVNKQVWYCCAIGIGYDNYGIQVSSHSFDEIDEIAANAAAKMLIYLIENKIIEILK